MYTVSQIRSDSSIQAIMCVSQDDIQAKRHYRHLLATYFSEGELRTLCDDLGIDYEDLPSEGKAGKARELVGHLRRRGRIDELLEIGKRERPKVPWDEVPAGSHETSSVFKGPSLDLSHLRLSDRLSIDPVLSEQFETLKGEWYKIAKLFMIPGLGKGWAEYCECMDQIADILIPRDWGSEDIFSLCCAIYLHKIGLVPNNRQKLSYVFNNYSLYSKDYILEFYDILGLDEDRADDIAWICYGHRDTADDISSAVKETTLVHHELQVVTRKGRKTRKEIACHLRILSRLGAIGVTIPDIFTRLYFRETSTSDYEEMRMNSVVSEFKIMSSDGEDSKVLLEVKFPKCENLIENLRFVKEVENTLKEELAICSKHMEYPKDSFFWNPTAALDTESLSREIEKCVSSKAFSSSVKDAIEKSLRSLLKSRNPDRNQLVKGWGPDILIESANFENYSDARVANTSEVLLAFTGWLTIPERVDADLQSEIVKVINDAIMSFDSVRATNLPARSESLEKELRSCTDQLSQAKGQARKILEDRIRNLEEKIKLEETYNPLTSLTFIVPTLRVNSLSVLTFTHLLDEMPNYLVCEGTKVYDEILSMMKGTIHWICKTDTGPFAEKVMTNLESEYLFQLTLSLKALIRSLKHWTQFKGLEYEQQQFPQQVADFVHAFIRRHNADSTWPKTPFKAMALEIFIFYISNESMKRFHEKRHEKTSVERLITGIVDELLYEVKIENFSLWDDKIDILRDEGKEHPKDWTHVTSAWAIEGLCECKLAGLLSKEQEKRLFQILPMMLLKQYPDGFYDSFHGQDGTRKSIFRTALYTYALTQVHKILQRDLARA